MDNLKDQRTLGTEDINIYHYTVSSVVYNVKVVAHPIQIRWKPEDRLTSTTSTIATSSDATADSSEEASSGLSTGAKIGLGVGLGLVGLIVLSAIIWWLRRRRVTRGPDQHPPTYEGWQKAELEASNAIPGQEPLEPAELPDRKGWPNEETVSIPSLNGDSSYLLQLLSLTMRGI
jgi:hypothetical protein